MKTCKIYSALLALILFVCLFGAQGQYNTPTSGYSARATISDMTQSTTSQYSQFYQMLSGPAPSNHIITPRKYEIAGNEPSTVLFSNQGLPVNYPQYASNPIYSGSNTLWIQGLTSWTQYAQVPQGSNLALMATSSTGGNGYLYEINPSGILAKNGFYFFQGSSQIGFYADTIGQHILLFIINSQVSNSIVIDVVPYIPPYQYPTPISSIQPYPQKTSNYQTSQQQPETNPKPILTQGDTPVHLISQSISIKGYQLIVDGNYIGTDGAGLDRLDGEIDFWLNGDQNHTIKVINGTETYQSTIFFQKGVLKNIYIERDKGIYT